MKTWKRMIAVWWTASASLAGAQVFPAIQWQQTFGGSGRDELTACLLTFDGGYLLGGASDSGVGGNKTERKFGWADFWVVKVDPSGAIQWQRVFGGDMDDYLSALAPVAAGGFLLGGWSRSDPIPGVGNKTAVNHGAPDFWLVKIDALGNMSWDRTYGGSGSQTLEAMVATGDGGFLLAGDSDSPPSGNKSSPNYGGMDFWLVKVGRDGQKQWDQSYGGNGREHCAAVVGTAGGGCLVGGYSASGVSGNKTDSHYGGGDIWVVLLDSNGVKQWDRTFGGERVDELSAIVVTTDGSFLLGGTSDSNPGGNKSALGRGDRDMWIIKIDSEGNKQWDESYGGTASELCSNLAAADAAGFLVAGFSGSAPGGNKTAPLYGNNDFWIVRVAASGTALWDQAYGGSGGDYLRTALATQGGCYVLAGSSGSSPSGTKTAPLLGPANSLDYWIVAIAGSQGPFVTAQPQSVTVSGGRDAAFSVEAFSAQSPLRYQWRFGGNDMPGAIGATLLLTN
ncbi:MAG: hypothetical protein FJ276_30045, partial [Planctomycetes bacterium]|nr:hypothetical protein [Planctomycetota bacterium]